MPDPKPEARKSAEAAKALARASESGDPAVHKLLADIQTARMNNDADRVKALTDELAKLGYE